GFPEADADRFREFVKNVLEGVNTPMEERIVHIEAVFESLDEQVADHVATPRDDLTSFLLNAKMGDEPLTEDHVTGTMALLLIAGIDKRWDAIGASIWHLADHPSDRQRIVDDPELLPTAMEELLRAYAPVT